MRDISKCENCEGNREKPECWCKEVKLCNAQAKKENPEDHEVKSCPIHEWLPVINKSKMKKNPLKK